MHPHPHPPMPPSPFPPYARWYSDIEPACERPAECECHFPPIPDNCVCVTEEDAENWNGAYSAISAVSAGLDIQAIASAGKLLASADYWNQTYNVVSAGSATWNQLPVVSSTLAETSQSALWLITEFLKTGVKHDDSLSGDGTNTKLGLDTTDFDTLYEKFAEIYRDITTAYDAKAIWEAMSACKQNYDIAINELTAGHKNNYELILQLMGIVPNSGNYPMIWASADMRSDNKSSYQNNKTLNWMYYSVYSGDIV